jgi:hypothetical protein
MFVMQPRHNPLLPPKATFRVKTICTQRTLRQRPRSSLSLNVIRKSSDRRPMRRCLSTSEVALSTYTSIELFSDQSVAGDAYGYWKEQQQQELNTWNAYHPSSPDQKIALRRTGVVELKQIFVPIQTVSRYWRRKLLHVILQYDLRFDGTRRLD